MNYYTDDERIDRSLGFPVVVRNAPMYASESGHTVFDVSPDEFQHAVLRELVAARRPWTGDNLHFVRMWLGDSMEDLAGRADVSKSAVHKWEQTDDDPTGMAKGTEYLLRVQVAHELRDRGAITAGALQRLVERAMYFDRDRTPEHVELDGMELVGDEWGDGSSDRDAAIG